MVDSETGLVLQGGAVKVAIRKSKSNTSMALMTAINPEGGVSTDKKG